MDDIGEVKQESNQSNGRCQSCDSNFIFKPDEDMWFDEQGYGYSTRLTRCPYCGKIVILGYIHDYGFNVNSDERFYK